MESKPKKQTFDLVDPTNPENRVVVTPGRSAGGYNLFQKRKYLKGVYDHAKKGAHFYEKLSLIAFEGSSLTLLGTLTYDQTLNKG